MKTSKLIVLVDFVIAIALAVVVVTGAYHDKDMSSVAIVAGLWDAQMAVAVGYYYWKAKNENRSKYAMKLVKQLASEYGMENVVQLAQTVLKD